MTNAVAMAAIPSPRPVSPSPSVVVADTETGAPENVAEHLLRLVSARADLRPVPDHLDRGVGDAEVVLVEEPAYLGEHRGTAHPGPFGPAGAEDRAEIAESGGGEQGVAECVNGDVAVGMTRAAVLVLEQQAGHPARPCLLDRMDVRADSDSHVVRSLVPIQRAPGQRRGPAAW